MFPGKPQESVGINPRVKPKRFSDLRDFSVECITHKHASKKGGLTGLYHCRNTNYYHAFHFYIVWLFLPHQNTMPSNFWQRIPRTFLVVSQQTNCQSIASYFSHNFTVFNSPTWKAQSSQFWQQIPLAHCCGAGRLLIAAISKVPLMPQSQPGCKLNGTCRGR